MPQFLVCREDFLVFEVHLPSQQIQRRCLVRDKVCPDAENIHTKKLFELAKKNYCTRNVKEIVDCSQSQLIFICFFLMNEVFLFRQSKENNKNVSDNFWSFSSLVWECSFDWLTTISQNYDTAGEVRICQRSQQMGNTQRTIQTPFFLDLTIGHEPDLQHYTLFQQ